MDTSVKVETVADLTEGSPFVHELALAILRSGLFIEETPVTEEVTKKPRKERKIQDKRSMLGKVKISAKVDFWRKYGDEALKMALNDKIMPTAANRTRTYKLYKTFFQNEWKNKKYFTMDELKKDIMATFGKTSRTIDAHGFLLGHRFQIIPWSNGVFYAEGGDVATKPICRKMARSIFLNIFHKDAKNITDVDRFIPNFARF